MNHRSFLVSTCCVMLLHLSSADVAIGQSDQCPAEDYRCLDQGFGAACMATPEGATAQTCAVWLAELLGRPDINEPETQEILGHTYLLLATLSEDPEVRQSYRDQANATFQSRSIESPTDVRPLYGLSAAAATREQSAMHLRRAVAVDPTDLQAVGLLARVLLNTAGIPAIVESIEIQEHAYYEGNLLNEMMRLRLASSIALHYQALIRRLESALGTPDSDQGRIADAQESFAQFIEQARQDLAIATRLTEIGQAPFDDPNRTVSHLSILCHSHAITVFGAGACIDSLDVVVEVVVISSATDVGMQLADAIGLTLRSMAVDAWMIDREFPNWRRHSAASLRELMSSGVQSETVYYTYFYMELENADARLATLLRGSELFPDSQRIRRALMSEYILRGTREEAIEQYLILAEDWPNWDGSREFAENLIDEQIHMRRHNGELYGGVH